MTDGIEANRTNASRSTGPRTSAGKSASAKNALRHGLLSKEALLPGDDAVAFQRLRRRLWAALQPAAGVEVFLAERVIALGWRLRRALVIEREMMAADLDEQIRWWRTYERGERPKPTLGQAVGRDLRGDDGLGKLTRYEAHLERGLFRALHELQRLQATRAGAVVAPPVALDVDVNMAREAGPI